MQYRLNKKGENVSALGFGCMRLPKEDEALCKKLLYSAAEKGINYFDTAYLYGGNEELLGKILDSELRDKINIASKLPHHLCKNCKDFDKIFYTTLKRLKTDRIDYYLIHSLNDVNVWQRLTRYGIKEWIKEKKNSGEIKNIGFSYHGATGDFKKLIDDYDWDFCQIQYNYIDENNQAGVQGLDYAYEHKIPVIIMEPLRGGKLTNDLPDSAKEILKAENKSASDIGLRWVWNHKGVMTVLSGMRNENDLALNLASAEKALPGSFPEEDFKTVEKLKKEINKYSVVPCTGCGYCLPCPYGVAIPTCFSDRNAYERNKENRKLFKIDSAVTHYVQSTGLLGKGAGNAAKCHGCGACEKKCPQHIEIRKALKETAEVMEPWYIKLASKVAQTVNSRK